MVLDGKYYIPEGFDEDSPAGRDEKTGLPKALIRDGRRFVLIEGDKFLMGDFNGKRAKNEQITFDRDEQPGHSVTLSSFYMQETEVSIGEFERFCADMVRNRTDFDVQSFFDEWKRLADLRHQDKNLLLGLPATGVSHRMAEAYARWIGGDLPTEAQWEFAARSRGKPQRYGWGDDPSSVEETANVSNPEGGPAQVDYDKTSDKKAKDVTKQGIYCLAGNVREWCRDVWGTYSPKDAVNPQGKPAGGQGDPYYVIRGGSYETPRETARATWRSEPGIEGAPYILKADGHQKDLGFRVVLEVLERQEPAATAGATAWRETRR
jgi:serine/threonine-protein kinase